MPGKAEGGIGGASACSKSPSGLPAISPTRGETTRGDRLPHRIGDGCGIRITIAIRRRCIMGFRPVGGGNRCLTVPLPLVGRVGRGLSSIRHPRRKCRGILEQHHPRHRNPVDLSLLLRQHPHEPPEPPRLIRARRREGVLRR